MSIEQEDDKIEDARVNKTLDWVEEEERKEREEREIMEKAQKEKDDQWMIDELKKQNGDDFGEDIDLNFEE